MRPTGDAPVVGECRRSSIGRWTRGARRQASRWPPNALHPALSSSWLAIVVLAAAVLAVVEAQRAAEHSPLVAR